MLRRVKKQNASSQQAPTGIVYGRVNGNYPAPPPLSGKIVLPTIGMNSGTNTTNTVIYRGGGYTYGDMGLDDYRALHYYGLDGFDNIDF